MKDFCQQINSVPSECILAPLDGGASLSLKITPILFSKSNEFQDNPLKDLYILRSNWLSDGLLRAFQWTLGTKNAEACNCILDFLARYFITVRLVCVYLQLCAQD